MEGRYDTEEHVPPGCQEEIGPDRATSQTWSHRDCNSVRWFMQHAGVKLDDRRAGGEGEMGYKPLPMANHSSHTHACPSGAGTVPTSQLNMLSAI